jgi:hypothetical protein
MQRSLDSWFSSPAVHCRWLVIGIVSRWVGTGRRGDGFKEQVELL